MDKSKVQLAHVLLTHALRVSIQDVLHVCATILQLGLDLRRRRVMAPARLRHASLAPDDLQHQRRLALGPPTLDLFVHQRNHGVFLSTVTPEQVFTGAIHAEGVSAKILALCDALGHLLKFVLMPGLTAKESKN